MRQSDLKKILTMRPEMEEPYSDFNYLREMINRRDELWVYDELVEWIETVDDDFREELSV